jgi:hypothetical protein
MRVMLLPRTIWPRPFSPLTIFTVVAPFREHLATFIEHLVPLREHLTPFRERLAQFREHLYEIDITWTL